MDDIDRDDLLANMYDDDEPVVVVRNPTEVPGFNRTRKVRVGIIEYELPTVEYVNRLEQMVARQAHLIEQQKRAIERLQGFMISTRNFIRRQTGRIADLQEDLDNKVDLRETV